MKKTRLLVPFCLTVLSAKLSAQNGTAGVVTTKANGAATLLALNTAGGTEEFNFLPLRHVGTKGNIIVPIVVNGQPPLKASLMITDLNGRLIGHMQVPVLNKGMNEVQWDLGNQIAAGTYTCTLMANGSFVARQEMIIKKK